MTEMAETASEGLRYEPIQPGSGRRGGSLRKRAAGAGAGLAALLAKAKGLLLLLPKVKLLATFGSAFVSIAAYARVGLAGPILGSLASAVPLAIWLATGSDFWRALAYVGFFINLFNLLPVLPLDGGRAMAALSPAIWLVGLAALLALLVFFPNPIMLLILVFGGIESWRRWRARNTDAGRAYHRVPPRTRALVAATYLGLAGLLAVGVAETFVSRGIG